MRFDKNTYLVVIRNKKKNDINQCIHHIFQFLLKKTKIFSSRMFPGKIKTYVYMSYKLYLRYLIIFIDISVKNFNA
jgi:hypothetical protein